MSSRTTVLLAALLLAPAAAVSANDPPAPSSEPPPQPAIAPDADRLLHRMTDYLSDLQSFRLHATSIDEVVTDTGEKIQIPVDSDVQVARPNRLQSTQLGSAAGMSFVYDGKTMTLYCKASNTYASVDAPPTLDAMIDDARKRFHLEAPGADLLYAHAYPALTEQVTAGRVVGQETIEGVPTIHLAFQGEEVDWQIWIQDGAEPLARRFVITTKTIKERPQFTVQLSGWDTHPNFSDTTFHFNPPAGANRVTDLPTKCRAP